MWPMIEPSIATSRSGGQRFVPADAEEMTDTPQVLTLETIGKLEGISRSTVSRVLNDHPDVRPEVRTRVEAVIEKTGDLPNQPGTTR